MQKKHFWSTSLRRYLVGAGMLLVTAVVLFNSLSGTLHSSKAASATTKAAPGVIFSQPGQQSDAQIRAYWTHERMKEAQENAGMGESQQQLSTPDVFQNVHDLPSQDEEAQTLLCAQFEQNGIIVDIRGDIENRV